MITTIQLRPPTSSAISSDFTPPSIEWISGTWHVTHSTLPMWKKSRNVTITYEPFDTSSLNNSTKLRDVVQHQSHTSDKIKTIEGVDTPGESGTWDWRGKGWLMIASSHWEVLGYGDEEDGEQWAVTYFEKTLFTPAGIDIYSRKKEGLSGVILEGIKGSLKVSESNVVKKLAEEIFEVRND